MEEEIRAILAQPFISRGDTEHIAFLAMELLDINEEQADMIKALIDQVEKLRKHLAFYRDISNIRPL